MTEPFECIATLRWQYGLKDKLLNKFKFIVINVDNKISQMILLTGHKKSKLFENFLKEPLTITIICMIVNSVYMILNKHIFI